MDAEKLFDAMNKAADAAEAAQFRSNFGKLTISDVRYMKFTRDESGWGVEDISLEEYLTLKRGSGMEVTLCVDIQEFNPSLDFNYERRVRVGSPDWRKTFASSVEAVLGKGCMSKANRQGTLKGLVGSYVETHDVPQQPAKNDGHINQATGEPYRTIKIARVFDTREACYEAYVERFGQVGEKVATGNPSGMSDAEWNEMRDRITERAAEMLDDGKGAKLIGIRLAKEFDVGREYVDPVVEELTESNS